MTRAYVTVVYKRAIINATYSPGDSYLSGLGKTLITAFSENRFEQWVEETNKEYPEYKQECEDIQLGWYRGNKNRNYVEEYGYEYDKQRDILNIYYYGKKVAVVTKENVSKWLLVANNEGHLFDVLCYDEKKMHTEYCLEKLYKMLSEMDLQQIQKAVNTKPEHIFEVEDYHMVDVWHRPERPSYIKEVKIRSTGRKITFICSGERNKWNIYIQLPYVRICVLSGYASETAAMKGLRNLLRQRADEFVSFADVYEMVESVRGKIKKEEKDKRTELRQVASAAILENWNKRSWYTAGGEFGPDKIIRYFREVEARD